ncbi:Beta-monoglucosyldiacylglycerol synthase [Hyella patelloides LEGE 07179]|uniref:Beta-monoglucosyldiacylglycerol synthase n=1 Tax=Hyella patelloides LEGE 07179 TaxID=945734 RepID=A0A563VMN2_9CYAN|nr:glycosyltransferase family 2 protein [Hyella patelloides]VEP12714.1 Beta-monoglucosyldiacylglycerol synthase [Hyella patelloides LEGE 07179]
MAEKLPPDYDLDPIESFLSEWIDPEDETEEWGSDFFQRTAGRRKKAAFVLMLIWLIVIGLHYVSWGYSVVAIVTTLMAIHIIRLLAAKPAPTLPALEDKYLDSAPTISLLVAAKNEEIVIARSIRMLCNLDYPTDKYEVWAIDDHSSDRTSEILDQLALEYPQLEVVHRSANAGGGKSGALNQVLSQAKGEIIGVFDADAGVESDLLRKVAPMFTEERMGAVQVRKAIANSSENFWTKGQAAEMLLDSYVQQKRIALDGIGELRGNGQFVRRSALRSCGGWNEETITDDLDLTTRLHLDNWKIGLLLNPAVEEEGVTKAIALWHQRNRWAEGGYQRYLDYWRYIFSNPIGFVKRFDLVCFVLLQYILPAANIPDLMMVLLRHRLPVLAPLSTLLIFYGSVNMFQGIVRVKQTNNQPINILGIAIQTFRGMIYMLHWQVVMTSITVRMSIRPKRLKWVKTVHEGAGNESFEY